MAFAEEEIEDGTGKSTALVYEQAADVAAWLLRRGFTKFNAKPEATQEAILINATKIGEEAIRPRFVGWPVVEDQAMLWPAVAAPDWRDREIAADVIPASQKEGVRLICEKLADGSYQSTLESSGIRREKHASREIEYSDTGRGSSFAELFPDIYQVLRRSLPRTVSS